MTLDSMQTGTDVDMRLLEVCIIGKCVLKLFERLRKCDKIAVIIEKLIIR